MEEEKKKSNKNISKYGKKINIQVKEIRLEKMSPGFNFVSLKARHRLNELKNLFSKSEYREYIRKCKNMYSISSIMNNKFSISDLYLREKYDINEIISVFNKIDSKLDSQKIKVVTTKRNKINNSFKNKQKTSLNFFKNNSNFEKFKSITNYNKNNKNSEDNNSLCSMYKNMNYNSYDGDNILSSNINEASSNNQISKTTCENKNKKNIISNFKAQYSFNLKNDNIHNIILKNKDFNPKGNLSKISNNKNNKIIDDAKNETTNNIKMPKLNKCLSDCNGILNIQSKQYPLSCKNNNFNITKFGAIIYNHSMFRNKNIINFIPKNYNLPLLYKNNKI